ncbi:ankyrin repeat domain-containing protein [Candidatus Poribacteria bacterium]|nr:ankyrin repeat domain-containing protein [Candidatus Poribacteria bacterium]
MKRFSLGKLSLLLMVVLVGSLAAYGRNPYEARKKLDELSIPFTVEAFVNLAAIGDSTAIALFLDAGMDIDSADAKYGMTALMHATIAGRSDIVKSLLDKGADINAKDKDGRTALILASGCGFSSSMPEEIEKRLYVIEKRRALDTHPTTVKTKRNVPSDDNPFEEGAAEKDGIITVVTRLDSHPDIVKTLLERGADANIQDNDGKTAIMSAAWHGHTEIVKRLLDMGANPNVKDRHSRASWNLSIISSGHVLHPGNGWTALMYAMLSSCPEVVRALLDAGADPNAKDQHGVSVLMIAAFHQGRTEVVQALLDAGADTNVKDEHGDTALDYATDSKHKDVVELLKKHSSKQ